ncbi:MAG: hypothetical protein K2P78_09680 [Gemmataceae bacterium]|nr:hypothetical protein [Gemmataceae bacterium]
MNRFRFASLALLAFATAAPAQDRRPVRLIAEGEDFTVKSGWAVVPYRENYYCGTFAITFLSRMACLGAAEQTNKPAVAEQVVTIPYDDTFEVLARYEQPFQYSAEFTVEVEQGGKVVARFPCGRLGDPKIWAFNNHQRVPMERYSWSGTDNIVWQNPGTVKLAAGPATLRLIADAQLENGKPRVNAARRHVDVVCLTNDRAGMEAQKKAGYLEYDGWLVQAGDLFVRFTNPKDGFGPCVPVVAPYDQGQHSPYYVHVRDWPKTYVLKTGRLTEPRNYQNAGPRTTLVKDEALAKPIIPLAYKTPDVKGSAPASDYSFPDAEYLQPGDSSGWVPVGPVLDALNDSQWFPQALYKGKAEGVFLRLEFAIPDGAGGLRVVKDVTVKGPAANLSPACFDVPGVVNPNPALAKIRAERYWPPVIRTQPEVLQWLNAEVAKFPNKGPAPKRFLLYNIMGFSGVLNAFPDAKQLALALGDNTTVNQEGKKRQLVAHWPDPTPDAIKKQEAVHKGGLDDVRIVSYGDEIHLPALPLTDAEFAAWLKDRGVSYTGKVEFIAPKPKTTPAEAEAMRKHPLYYYSQIAAKEKGGRHFAAGTAYYKSKGVLTGANYSPHANYLVTEIDYVRPFKLRAMSMPWAEDYAWQIAEFSPQVMGYLTSGLRAGAKYDDLPIHMYVMPHSPGQLPDEFRKSFYTAVGHGAKMVNYFCATPSAVGYTENYVDSNDLPMWRQIHACSHEAGVFEDYVMDGKVRPAKVGLLLSSVDELVTGVNNFSLAVHNTERKAVYYALRHAQVPVDFLSEDDVIEGRAKDYRLIYVTQQYVHSKCVAALQQWCEAGGTVVALCGGGMYDEFQKENPAARKLYGAAGPNVVVDPQLVPKYLTKENVPFLSKHDLPRYEPIDVAGWVVPPTDPKAPGHDVRFPVMVWKQPLAATDGGRVIGTFRDGSPAVVTKEHGKGRAVLFGFLPGQAYLKSGLPVRPVDRGASPAGYAHFLPTGMNGQLREWFVDAFLPAPDARPVVCSAPLVESTCIDTPPLNGQPSRLAVTLINWTPKRVPELTVVIPNAGRVTRVRSVERGPLEFVKRDESVVVTLPLDAADMLLIDR